jgi:hypothetical protein
MCIEGMGKEEGELWKKVFSSSLASRRDHCVLRLGFISSTRGMSALFNFGVLSPDKLISEFRCFGDT